MIEGFDSKRHQEDGFSPSPETSMVSFVGNRSGKATTVASSRFADISSMSKSHRTG